MTNPPPHGGSVTPSSGSTDFGATTLSGRSATNHGGAPTGTATESDRNPPGNGADPANDRSGDGKAAATAAPSTPPPSAQTRVDLPVTGATGAPPSAGAVPGPDAPGAAAPGSTPATPASIRGIRTGRNRGPRRARLQIRHINPITVLKFSCVLSVALFFVWLIVIGVLFGILDAAGVINNINDTVTQLNGTGSKPPVTAGIVFGGAAIVGVINIVLFIALSTIGSVIYNLCADLVGGVEITLSER